LVCDEQKPPLVFKNTFSFVHNPSFKLVTQKLQKRNVLSAETQVWSLRGCLEAFPEDFWAARDMVGNIMMSATQWNHQVLQTPSQNP
jgi:hypothetical protein